MHEQSETYEDDNRHRVYTKDGKHLGTFANARQANRWANARSRSYIPPQKKSLYKKIKGVLFRNRHLKKKD